MSEALGRNKQQQIDSDAELVNETQRNVGVHKCITHVPTYEHCVFYVECVFRA